MTDLLSRSTNGSSVRGPRLTPPKGRRRRPALAVILVLAATLGALGAVSLYSSAGARQQVLVLARDVAPGQAITAADLRVVSVSADPMLRPVAASQRGAVVGKTARAQLAAGTLLSGAQLGAPLAAQRGEVVVGLALKAGRYPSGLRAGDKVVVVIDNPPSDSTSKTDAAVPRLGSPVGEARILSASRPAEGSSSGNASGLISIVTDDQIGPTVAGASAADRVSLILAPAA